MVLFTNYEPDNDDNELKKVLMDNLTTHETIDRDGRLYASDCAFCHKQSTLNSKVKRERKLDPSFHFYVKSGITSEGIVKNGFGDALLFEEYELPDVGINLGGRVDGLVHYKDQIWCAELKQVGAIPNKPIERHEAQAMIYSAITGFPALVVYTSRHVKTFNDPFLMKTFELDNSYENRFKFLQRAVMSHLYNKENLIPSKPEYRKVSHCSYCDWKGHCWGDAKLDFDGLEFANDKQHLEILEQSNQITKALLNEKVIRDRTTGILVFLERNGRKHVKKLLKGTSWDQFLTSS